MLEIRHLIHHQPLTADLRKQIIDGINQYGEYVAKQQDQHDHLKTVDERPEDERTTADLVKEKVCLLGFIIIVINDSFLIIRCVKSRFHEIRTYRQLDPGAVLLRVTRASKLKLCE